MCEIPDDRGDQHRENHGESCFGADLKNQFDWQQRNNPKGDSTSREQNSKEIEKPDQTTATGGTANGYR